MLGAQLITQVSILIKMSRLHGRSNSALDNPVDTALTVIKTLADDEPISVRIQNDFLFLGQRHIKVTAAQMPVFSVVIDTLNQWSIGGISFSSEVDSVIFREFIFQIARFDPASSSLSTLRTALEQNPHPSQTCLWEAAHATPTTPASEPAAPALPPAWR